MKPDSNIIRKIPVFSELEGHLIEKIAELTIIKKYAKNDIIFFEGDPGEAIHFVKSGKVKIFKTSEGGKEIIINILNPGDIFAEVILFQKNIPYPASVEVIEEGEIGSIRNRDLERLISENPQLAVELLRAMAKKLKEVQQRVRELGSNDAIERTIRVLSALAKNHGSKTKDGIVLCKNITRQDMANLVGTTRETMSRILSKFSKEGLVEIKGRTIVIKNADALEEYYI
ncbi:Crp/Fnr family transcriptional regulator [Desulfitibacter alkalitolerans]|uniref:Crp/Fnr family transcriptional regulator n=1 Tax=Desulfitibacter alkalitolerans TaxID=264641 RepID=UPI00048902C9|nr:Crp/Fnr family transcriptional regulator [Desulfitibacter alkalitolerans]